MKMNGYTKSNRVSHAHTSLSELQHAFTQSIRSGEKSQHTEIKCLRHFAVYQNLLFKNINSLVSNCFPVLTSILSESYWQHLVRMFFEQHHATTPYFHQIPEEFISFLQSLFHNTKKFKDKNYTTVPHHPRFLLALAHYEWAELALETLNEDISELNFSEKALSLENQYQCSPAAWILHYHYPVHLIGNNFIPIERDGSLYYYAVYRNRKDNVKFMQLNAMSAKLLAMLETPQSGKILFEKLAHDIQPESQEFFIQQGTTLLKQLISENIVFIV